MCRYGMTSYKPHYACFNCKKTFKRRLLADIKNGSPKDSYDAKCPECGSIMADMGLDFESPKKTDFKAWNHIQALYQSGITFHSCGCVGPGFVPIDLEEHLKLLREKRASYMKSRDLWGPLWSKEQKDLPRSPLTRYQRSKSKEGFSHEESLNFWIDKIDKIEQRIKELSS